MDEKKGFGFGVLLAAGIASLGYAVLTHFRLEQTKATSDTRLELAKQATDELTKARENMTALNGFFKEEMQRPAVAMLSETQIDMLAGELTKRLFVQAETTEPKKKPN